MKFFQRKFTPEAKTLIRRLPPVVKTHIRALTDKILEDPFLGRALQRELTGYYSAKHSHYRVIYEIDTKRRLIIIEYVGVRKDIYDLFIRFLRGKKWI